MELSILVKNKRKEKGMTAKELSEYLGKSISYVSQIESGRIKDIDDSVFREMAKILEITDLDVQNLKTYEANSLDKQTLLFVLDEISLIKQIKHLKEKDELLIEDLQLFIDFLVEKKWKGEWNMQKTLENQPNYDELLLLVNRYQKALEEIYRKGGYKIRGNVANELADIAHKALKNS